MQLDAQACKQVTEDRPVSPGQGEQHRGKTVPSKNSEPKEQN